MGRFFSRTAFIVTVGYAILTAAALVAAWRVSDFESRAFYLLFIGLPWVLALLAFRESAFLYFLVITLNVATVYALALSVVRLFGRDSN
jgi:CelD/BcsL family acetyltransferase involved in cellulose biosynthesis